MWEFQWTLPSGEPIRMPRRAAARSLFAISLNDTAAGFQQSVLPLPGGQGVALYLNSHAADSFRLVLTADPSDSLWTANPQKLGDRLWTVIAPDSTALAFASSEAILNITRISPVGKPPVWRMNLALSKQPHVTIASGKTAAEALARAQHVMHHSVERLEAAAADSLRAKNGFTLHTSDERADRVFALLGATLSGAEQLSLPDIRPRIEDAAQQSTALYLASRRAPEVVFPRQWELRGEQQERDRLRWGSGAYRATLNWGMAPPDTLKQLALEILFGLSRLQAEYLTADVEVVADDAVRDSLMRLAVAHVRYAELMTLGEEIALSRGDHEAKNNFRREALRAAKKAQGLLAESTRRYRRLEANPRRRLESVLDTSAAPAPEDDERGTKETTYPDTALFLRAGARYGFNWLDPEPLKLWNPRLAIDAFTWQRFMAYRYRMDAQIAETPDFDSLATLLLEGPALDLNGMAAAYQNVAEIYLGIRPEALTHRLKIEPRPPVNWGRTAARVPFRGRDTCARSGLRPRAGACGADRRDDGNGSVVRLSAAGRRLYLRAVHAGAGRKGQDAEAAAREGQSRVAGSGRINPKSEIQNPNQK